MDFDEDKIDEYTLALLYLVAHERHEGLGARAWKGFDWDTLNRLHEKGYISNPIGKAKSVGMSEEGFHRAKELFEHRVKVGQITENKMKDVLRTLTAKLSLNEEETVKRGQATFLDDHENTPLETGSVK